MLVASIPYKFVQPWGNAATSGFVTDPVPPTAAGGFASQAVGFPPVTSVPIGSGGAYPLIEDINGLGFYTTLWDQWQQAGGPLFYDAAFSGNIGGYMKGAVLANASTVGAWWISTVDNNTSDPDTGGANWTSFIGSAGASGYQKLPSGVIQQWATGTTATGNGDTITFPIAFPTACDLVVVSEQAAGGSWAGGAATLYGASSKTATNFALWAKNIGATGIITPGAGISYGYLAMGH